MLIEPLGGGYEVNKKRMRSFHRAFQLRVILASDEKWMGGYFHQFDQPCFRITATGDHARRFVLVEVPVIEFIAVPVPF